MVIDFKNPNNIALSVNLLILGSVLPITFTGVVKYPLAFVISSLVGILFCAITIYYQNMKYAEFKRKWPLPHPGD